MGVFEMKIFIEKEEISQLLMLICTHPSRSPHVLCNTCFVRSWARNVLAQNIEPEEIVDITKLIGCKVLVNIGDSKNICYTKISQFSQSEQYVNLSGFDSDIQCPGWQKVKDVRVLEVISTPDKPGTLKEL